MGQEDQDPHDGTCASLQPTAQGCTHSQLLRSHIPNLDTTRLPHQCNSRHATLSKEEAIYGLLLPCRCCCCCCGGRPSILGLAPKIQGKQLVAVRILARRTPTTGQARGEGEHDGVAGLDVGHIGADGADVAGALVAEDQRRWEEEGAGGGADVRVADGGADDVDEDFVGAGGGVGHRLQGGWGGGTTHVGLGRSCGCGC